MRIGQDSIWRAKSWYALIIALSLMFFIFLFLQIELSNSQTKEIENFKAMNCQDQKQFLLKNVNENKVGIYPYSTEQAFYELECLSK